MMFVASFLTQLPSFTQPSLKSPPPPPLFYVSRLSDNAKTAHILNVILKKSIRTNFATSPLILQFIYLFAFF